MDDSENDSVFYIFYSFVYVTHHHYGDRDRKLLSVSEVAKLIGTTRRVVREMIKKGKFPGATRLEKEWRIPEKDVRDYLERRGWQPKGEKEGKEGNKEEDN